ncbi:MAG: UvrD-helicase domain-containing protein, partial [Desulfobacterales bacterium]|nr:UvrD-helicase domain-containing protein [Desulfobacterales bacterium]
YHLDGHRKCSVCLWPKKTVKNKGICPVCGKPLTVGVLYRVEELADRPKHEKPKRTHPYYSIIPLVNILSEILKVGPGSKKVMNNYNAALDILGPELSILHNLQPKAIDKAGIPLLGEAVKRMRREEIDISPGYDGEFGRVKIFKDQERERLMGQKSLFVMPETDSTIKTHKRSITKQQNKKTELKQSLQDLGGRRSSREKGIPAAGEKTKNEINILKGLNTQQRQAVCHDGGPLLIVAGPGTGKTHTITCRIACLIKEKDVLPESILAVTFTNKAAREMKDRIKRITGSNLIPNVSTFHSLCLKILKDMENNQTHTIIDDDDRMALISEAIKQAGVESCVVSLSKKYLLDRIISAKQQILQPHDNLEGVAGKAEINTFARVYQAYQDILSAQSLYDFEDLILKVVLRFEADKEFANIYRQSFKYIFVDEYQDINHGQYRIIKALAPPDKDLCVIGDPNQSIYGFRGSDVRFFERFLEDYPQGSIIHLNQNYRSTQTILEASYQIITNRSIDTKTDNLSTSRVYSQIDGVKTISILELASEKAEAVAIGKTIEALTGGLSFHAIDSGKIEDINTKADRSFSDFTVLYRTNSQSKIIGQVFEKAGIPCQIASRESLFRQKGVVELVSMLKIMDGHGSFADLKRGARLLSPGISDETIKIFTRWCCQNHFILTKGFYNAQRFPIPGMSKARQLKFHNFLVDLSGLQKAVNEKSVEEKLHFIINNTKLASTLKQHSVKKEAVDRLTGMSKEFGDNAANFFEMMALQTDTDIYDSRVEKVALMTMHAAKGLEFPVVFIAGCEKGFIPFIRPGEEPVDLDEERRLFYVAMTRARERLYLTMAKKRTIYGKRTLRTISPFVEDIEQRLIKRKQTHLKKKKKESRLQLTLF